MDHWISISSNLSNNVMNNALNNSENVTKTLVNALPSTVKNINFKNWRTWVMIFGLIIAIYIMFWNSNNIDIKTDVEPPIPTEMLQHAHPLDIGNKHYALLNNSSGNERIYHYQLTTRNYEQALHEMNPNSPEYAKLCFRLAQIYHTGVPESYDPETDNKIPGIPPDTERAITYYQFAIQYGYHSAILDLANIFHWGNVGFKPNRDYARHLYGAILKVGTPYEQGLARDRLRQMQEEEGKVIGSVMEGLDGEVGNNFSSGSFASGIFSEQFSSVGGSMGGSIGGSMGGSMGGSIGGLMGNTGNNGSNNDNPELTKGIDNEYVKELIENDLHLQSNRIDKKRERVNIIPNDTRNANDHMVMNTAKQSLERLKSSTHIQYDMPTTLKLIHTYIVQECDLNDQRKADAVKVLQYFAANITKLGYDQAKELEALHIVFNRIQSNVHDKKDRTNLMDNLIKELSECIEYGELVCTEGRLNRIIDTLNGIDPLVQIKPRWALTQEMMNKCAALRKQLIAKETSETADALEAANPTARQKLLIRTFYDRFKQDIERDFIKTYVDGGIMTKDMLQTEMNKWIDSI